MRKLLITFLLVVLLLSLTGCTNVQRRDNKVQKELEDRGWECKDTFASFTCELNETNHNYYISSENIHHGWSYEIGELVIMGYIVIDMQFGNFTHTVDGFKDEEIMLSFLVQGNVYSGDVTCISSVESLDLLQYEKVQETLDLFIEVIDDAGYSLLNYNQSEYGREIKIPRSVEDTCVVVD